LSIVSKPHIILQGEVKETKSDELGLGIQLIKTIDQEMTDTGSAVGGKIESLLQGEGKLALISGAEIRAGLVAGANGTVEEVYGLVIEVTGQGKGYGLYLKDVAGESAYGLYQAGADDWNYFAGKVGIGVERPHSTLQVNGSIAKAVTTKAEDYTLTDSDSYVRCDASAGARRLRLPSAKGIEGREYTIKKIDPSSNICTIQPEEGETIEGAESYQLTTQWQYLTIISTGMGWEVIGR